MTAVSLEVKIEDNDIIITAFPTDKSYLKNFDLLWSTASSKEDLSIRISSKDDAGGRADFSAHTANQNIQDSKKSIGLEEKEVKLNRWYCCL